MQQTSRATIYLAPALRKALKIKAATFERSLSDLVNEAIRHSLAEDSIDLEAISRRRNQPERSFESFVAGLKKDGLL